MTSKELAKEIRTIITYLCEVSSKQDKYALECCDELDKKLEILEILKKHFNFETYEYKWGNFLNIIGKEDSKTTMLKNASEYMSTEEIQKLKEWLNG